MTSALPEEVIEIDVDHDPYELGERVYMSNDQYATVVMRGLDEYGLHWARVRFDSIESYWIWGGATRSR